MDHKLFDDVMARTKERVSKSQAGQKRSSVVMASIELNEASIELVKNRFIAFDVETTGLNSMFDRIIEIGAVLFENGIETKSFRSFIRSDIKIRSEASRVNHITDEMIANAPSENEVIERFVAFLGDALQCETVICAHNASFDMGFLREAFRRNCIEAKMYYLDTCALSRTLVHDVDNYKQSTLADSFGIINEDSHRAVTDARVCGQLMLRLVELKSRELEEQKRLQEEYERKQREKNTLSDQERKICAYIQIMIQSQGRDTQYLGFARLKDKYVGCFLLHTIVRFKTAKKGTYFLIESKYIIDNLKVENCTASEGGESYIRVFVDSIDDISYLREFIVDKYDSNKRAIDLAQKHDKYLFEQYLNSPAMTYNSMTDEQAKEYVRETF